MLVNIKDQVPGAWSGQRVLVRVDYNVAIVGGQISDTYRIDRSLPTINYLLKAGARVILLSHLGDDGEASLKPVFDYLRQDNKLSSNCLWAADLDSVPGLVATLTPGQVILVENIRRESGEKINDLNLTKRLANLADCYVNDAFAVAHRAHASVAGVTEYLPSYAGLLLAEEVEQLSKILKPDHPFIAILGGAKFSTKLPLIQKLLDLVDQLYLGGALAHVFYRAKGYEIGQSLVESDLTMVLPFVNHPKIILPEQVVVRGTTNQRRITSPKEVGSEERIVDADLSAIKSWQANFNQAKLIMWNGPLGQFEGGDEGGTLALARALALAPGETIIGGGDTLVAIEKLNLLEHFSFASTGGGAMLDFIASGGQLPALIALAANQGQFKSKRL